jgi:uncharacterized protein (DUF885 family)
LIIKWKRRKGNLMRKAYIERMTTITCKSIILLSSLAFTACAQSRQRPQDIEILFRNFVIEYIELKPETGTVIGFPPAWGINVKNDELDDESEQGLVRVYDLYRKYRQWLSEYDRDRLTSSQRVAADVLTWFLDSELQGENFRNHPYIIHPMFGFHSSFVSLMTEHHRISDLADAEDYISRLGRIKVKISQILPRLEKQRTDGIIPPLQIVEAFLQMLIEFTQGPYDENLLYVSFKDRISNLKSISNGTRAHLLKQCLEALEQSVYPAYSEFIDSVQVIQRTAGRDAGVWKLPNGDEYYQYCLRQHTTTGMTPEEIHDLGLAEVERIQGELTEQFKKLGITGGDKFSDLLRQYIDITGNRRDKKYFYPATEEGKIQTLLAYQTIIDSMQDQLPLMFSRIPSTKVHVMRVPEYRERISGTYYQPPKLDGSEQGIFYANLLNQHRKEGMKALTYHEAIPGHHLQIALEQEQSEARLFKTLFFFTGYVEGWALYAEKLAGEYGFYSDPYSLIGYLRSELLRALRLVVDTGIHRKKWTREKAYAYLLENLGWSEYSQIDRYVMWPGQACAYKVGELKILELRARAQAALAEKFDIKDFHDVVLRQGSVPLDILEKLVDDYIKSKRI